MIQTEIQAGNSGSGLGALRLYGEEFFSEALTVIFEQALNPGRIV